MDLLQHKSITSVQAGHTELNPNNNVYNEEREGHRLEPKGTKPVWLSIGSTGGLIARDCRGRFVATSTITWMPGASTDVLRPLLENRYETCQNLCALVAQQILSETELHWMATNLATVETALEKARSLMPTENDMKSGDPVDHSAQKVSARIREEEARKAAGLPIVLGLKQLAKAQDRNKVNHVTVAFAAAYLLHYMPRVDKTRYIQQADIAKLIVKMIGKYSRHGKDDGCVKLLAYDTAGGWLREYIAKKDKRSGSDSQKKKQRTRKGNSIIHVSRDELKGLRDMSAIASANMGICCTTYEQLDTAGLSWSPFQRGHHILGYVCAGHPLFNKYYQVAMNELCGNGPMPLTPRGSLAPSIPQAALEDPALNERIGSLRKTVRRICSADMSSDPKDMTSHISHASQQTRVLRYHSAIFFVALTEFSKQTSECLDLGDDEDTTRNIIMQNLDDITRFLDKVEKKGWLDTTTANSAYSEAYLRSRHHILAEHIQAYTRNDPSRQPDLVVDEKDGGPLSPGGADKVLP
ncbi:hypothetical protein HBI80_082590 [Parastagonospora nodorum]|nr:hypothetical protein HBI80_082590 [Parastagonospora nodorum]